MKNLIYMGWRFYFVTLSDLVSSNFVILSEKTPVEFSAGIFIMVFTYYRRTVAKKISTKKC